MPQDPLHVLWIEPHFPGRLGWVADWLVRRRGFRCWFYCHTADPPERWPESVGRGLDVTSFQVGGVAREPAVAWSRVLERSLCYAYGCWEVLEMKRPRPVDLVVGRSAGLGASLFAPVYRPDAPVVNFFDDYYNAHDRDPADEAGPDTPAAYYQWRRSANAVELLDLENGQAAWTPTGWQRDLFPREYRNDFTVLHDGIDTRLFRPAERDKPRAIAGRIIPAGTRVVTFVAQTLERLRGFDRFLALALSLIRTRSDVLCVVVGEPIVRRGRDVQYHQRDYRAHLLEQGPAADPERLWFLGGLPRAGVAEVLAASDLHVAPSRRYPVARSVLEAMASGCVVLASDTEPHREVFTTPSHGLLARPDDPDDWARQAGAVLDDLDSFRPVGASAAARVREHYAQDATLPRLAEFLNRLARE